MPLSYTAVWTAEDSWFHSLEAAGGFPPVSGPVLRPAQPYIQRSAFRGGKAGGVADPSPHSSAKVKTEWRCT